VNGHIVAPVIRRWIHCSDGADEIVGLVRRDVTAKAVDDKGSVGLIDDAGTDHECRN
jgi:hypothetical protein